MKKWMYLIFPGAMLGLFLVFYAMDSKRMAERDHLRAVETARLLKEQANKQAGLKQKAEEDARRRSAERAAAEAKKEADKLARWNAESQMIKETTDKANGVAESHSKKIAALGLELASLRANREATNRDYVEQLKNTERAKIDQRSAELEIQRTVEMIAKRAAESSLTVPPPPPPQPAAEKEKFKPIF